MTAAFDLALFVPAVAPVAGQAPGVTGPSPLTTAWQTPALASAPGVVVGASVPGAVAEGFTLVSGAAPDFAWTLAVAGEGGGGGSNVPDAGAQNQVILSGASPGFAWSVTPLTTMLSVGGAITSSAGGLFGAAANLVFSAAATLTTRLNGGNPSMSAIDNFTIDAGTF